jgi:hypothetical protein
MKFLTIIILSLASFGWLQTAAADPRKDESGHGGRGGDYRYGSGYDEKDRKLKFYTRDGCEVERKWKKGEYEEKVKCKPGRYGYRD